MEAGSGEFNPNIDFKTNPESGDFEGYKCSKCKDTGIVKEKDGSCHTCWDCLREGRLDCHSKDLPDAHIRL